MPCSLPRDAPTSTRPRLRSSSTSPKPPRQRHPSRSAIASRAASSWSPPTPLPPSRCTSRSSAIRRCASSFSRPTMADAEAGRPHRRRTHRRSHSEDAERIPRNRGRGPRQARCHGQRHRRPASGPRRDLSQCDGCGIGRHAPRGRQLREGKQAAHGQPAAAPNSLEIRGGQQRDIPPAAERCAACRRTGGDGPQRPAVRRHRRNVWPHAGAGGHQRRRQARRPC